MTTTTTPTTTTDFSVRADLIRALQSAPYGAQRGMAVLGAAWGFLFARLPRNRSCGTGISAASFDAALRAEKMYLERAGRVAALLSAVPEPRASVPSGHIRMRPRKGIPGPIPAKRSPAGPGVYNLPEDREALAWADRTYAVRLERDRNRRALGEDPLALPQEHRTLLRARRALSLAARPWPRPYRMGWETPGGGHPDALRWLQAAERWTKS